ncbi:WD40, TFIID 90kDa, and/or Nup160 domain containing protein [Asbolus verrucosus]|uniref:WD40, TFIID 90kDa, and/or Nup160 domain containing protein n=1 Tax=Asbolus verrucosus TaxID=1661398 RepID=A0A482VJH4_ASBVE|nr:WD40, TFIID 90kDa, and/or Nup160 domain containing protein [Asbolus verrucosus]
MDETKRDVNKTKRSKNDHVKNIVQSYLQKRNYASIGLQENSRRDQQITYSLVEKEISRPNSILYSCYNSDPLVIDHNFIKFLSWVKDLVKNKNICHDIEYLVAPLFCHLYLDILKGGHSERAANFCKAHLPVIDKTKCDDFVKDLINLFANDSDATCMIEQYRSNKYFLELSPRSLSLLKKFVIENCHVVFLHVLQTWFDLQERDEKENEIEEKMEEKSASNGICTDNKFQKMLDVIQDLKKEPKQLFSINISFTNEPVTCALIKRTCGLIAYNQNNIVHLRPIHSYDSIMGIGDCKEIKLIDHSKRVYSLAISPDHHTLVTASEDGNLCIYSLSEMNLTKKCSGHLGPVYCVTISSNSAYVASGSYDNTARLWNIDTGQTLRIFVGHTQAVTCLDFHPNCLYLATGSADKNVRLWSVDNGSPLRLFHGSKGVVYSVVFSPLGDTLASASDDKKVRLWDILASKINSEFKHKGESVMKIVWSKDGKQLCTGSIDGTIRIWDVGHQQDGSSDNKNQEPSMSFNVNAKILALEYSFETFACITA